MSDPARQMNSRRLPPLPGSGSFTAGNSRAAGMHAPRSPRSARLHRSQNSPTYHATSPRDGHTGEMLITGHSPSYYHQDASPVKKHDWYESNMEALDTNPEIVTSFLNENPDYLESYIHTHVNRDTLERWLLRRTQKHKHKNGEIPDERRETVAKWKFYMHADKRQLLQDLTQSITHNMKKPHVLHELIVCMASAVNADGYNLYIVDEDGQDLYYYKPNASSTKSHSPCVRRIGAGTTLAAYVAHTKQNVRLGEMFMDEHFPEGIPMSGDTIQSVLAQPIVHADGLVVGVAELYRKVGNRGFTEDEEEVVASYLLLGSMITTIHEMYHTMTKQRKLNEFLLAVTKSIFQDIVSMDTVIMKIMNFAKKLVLADRASLFLVDTNTNELYARIFDTGEHDENSSSKPLRTQKEIRFPMDKGVAGHVATTGEVLNIKDAYADDRFNRDVDLQTGYTTKTILCMPIKIRGNIIGVVQMVNKLNGTFTKSDEESFETFAIYCGLALHHAKLYDKIRRSEQKYKVALEVLSYHGTCSEEEVQKTKSFDVPDKLPELIKYDFSPWSVDNDQKPIYVIHMLKDLFDTADFTSSWGNKNQKRYDLDTLYRFTLTVRKNYRAVPYHNWAHAFSVAHAMFTVIKTTSNKFKPIEALGLFVACLCHDLDHRGKTNSFMVKSASPLAAVYSTSTMEHHHFNQTVTILQNEGHNIFKNLCSEEYKQVLGDIRHCILATDLALFFGNRARLKDLAENKQLSWDNDDHRHSIMAHCMTAADLCSMYKPWDLQVELVHVIMEEFWQQGDEEKAKGEVPIPMNDRDQSNKLPALQGDEEKKNGLMPLRMMDRSFAHELPDSQGDEEKKQGLTPIEMMDRDRKDMLPQLEVGFLVGICLPCYELLAQVLPPTSPMVEGAKANLEKWKELADKQKELEKEKEKESEEKENKLEGSNKEKES